MQLIDETKFSSAKISDCGYVVELTMTTVSRYGTSTETYYVHRSAPGALSVVTERDILAAQAFTSGGNDPDGSK